LASVPPAVFQTLPPSQTRSPDEAQRNPGQGLLRRQFPFDFEAMKVLATDLEFSRERVWGEDRPFGTFASGMKRRSVQGRIHSDSERSVLTPNGSRAPNEHQTSFLPSLKTKRPAPHGAGLFA